MLTSRRMLQVRENIVRIVTLVTLKEFAGYLSVLGNSTLLDLRDNCFFFEILMKRTLLSVFLSVVRLFLMQGFNAVISISFTLFLQQIY